MLPEYSDTSLGYVCKTQKELPISLPQMLAPIPCVTVIFKCRIDILGCTYFRMLYNACIRNTWEPFALFKNFKKTKTVLNFLGLANSFEACSRWGNSVLFLPSPSPQPGCGDEEGPFRALLIPSCPAEGARRAALPCSGCCGCRKGRE